jgi:hypothetical protein
VRIELNRGTVMATKSGRAWKLERASVSENGKTRPRSNKYSTGDSGREPSRGSRQQVWVGGYKRADGTKVGGYYRATAGNG